MSTIQNRQPISIQSPTVAGDVKAALLSADQSVSLLREAAKTVGAGGDGRPLMAQSDKLAADLLGALRGFLEGKPLLAANEVGLVKDLGKELAVTSKKADEGQTALKEANRGALKSSGAVEYKMGDLGAWNDQMLAQKLVEQADKTGKPAFAEYFNSFMLVQPGTAANVKERAEAARQNLQENGSVSGTLSNASQQALRRVEITEAQSRPIRSNEDIIKASTEKAVKNGYKEGTLAAQIGYALQDVAHHGEIKQFSRYLMELSLTTDGVRDIKDPAERMDRARDRAAYWVGNYGRNERVLDDVWYASLREHTADMKAAASKAG